MTENAFQLLFASLGFTFIASLTWFFSTHRKLFIRIFVPEEVLLEAVRAFGQNSDFKQSMRLMATLQFVLSGAFWISFLFAWNC